MGLDIVEENGHNCSMAQRKARTRLIALCGALVVACIVYMAAWYPRYFGWPGVFIVSEWTPGPLRSMALLSFNDSASKDDLPLIKEMLRSDDPRIRRRGIVFIDHFRSMDEFNELERLTRDPDPEVRASAYAYLPFLANESLGIAALMAGLRDDSDAVVAVAAEKLLLIHDRQALPDLIYYLQAKRQTGTFVGADIVVGNAAAQLAGLKLKFSGDLGVPMCGNPAMWDYMERNRPFPRAVMTVRAFAKSLRGDWDDGMKIRPAALEPVYSGVIADNFVVLEKLLAWWESHGRHDHTLQSKTAGVRKVRNSSK